MRALFTVHLVQHHADNNEEYLFEMLQDWKYTSYKYGAVDLTESTDIPTVKERPYIENGFVFGSERGPSTVVRSKLLH